MLDLASIMSWLASPLLQIILGGLAGIVVWHLIPARLANVRLVVQIVFFLTMSALLLRGRIVPYESTTGDESPAGTVLVQDKGVRSFALEGSVFVAGSLIKWLRDAMGLVGSAAETAALAASVPDSGRVVLVPALSGLGAPHWRPDASAALTGMTFSTTRAHVVRAALEAMALQTHDLAAAFAGDGARWTSLRIDGGMSANDWIAQDLADMLGLPVERPGFVETTALGAAMLAGLGAGQFGSLDEAGRAMRGAVRRFDPQMQSAERDARLALWRAALATV